MTRLGFAVAALGLPVILGCSYIGSRSAEPSESPSVWPDRTAPATEAAASVTPSIAATPSPTAIPLESKSPSPTASPVPTIEPSPAPSASPLPGYVSGLAASDRFWQRWYDTCWFGAFPISSSLAEITRDSDLVIRGSIADLYSSKSGLWELPYVKVAISDVLKGEPNSRQSGMVEVQIGYGGDAPSDLEELRSQLPAHDHLWFLTGERIEPNRPGDQPDFAGYTYFPTDYLQVSVLRDIGGVVEVIWPDAISNAFSRRHYPVPLDGTSFDELVEKVSDLAAESSSRHGYARRSSERQDVVNRWDAC